MNTFKKTGGFTLVELIIVIAILAILSSVAVAGYSSYITKANNSAVETFLNNISTAATLANAKVGGIKEIKVTEVTGGLQVVIEGTNGLDATDFVNDLQNAISGLTGSINTTDGDANEGKYVGTITAPNAWDGSKYGTANAATWNGTKWN